MCEFKRQISEALVAPKLARLKSGLEDKENTGSSVSPADHSSSERHSGLSQHHLLQNIDKKLAQCYLCKLVQKGEDTTRSAFGCMECGVALHVDWFTAYHRAVDMRGINDGAY